MSDHAYRSRLYDQNIAVQPGEVSLTAMSLLFQELIKKTYKDSQHLNDFENKLSQMGQQIGAKLLELLNFRASVGNIVHSGSIFSSSTTSNNNNSNISNDINTTAISNTTSKTITSTTHANKTKTDNKVENNSSTISSNQLNNEFMASNNIQKMKRRDLKVIDILQFIHGAVWSYLFNHVSNDLVKSSERDNEFMIIDNEPVLTQFINISHFGSHSDRMSCEYFTCGIIKGLLNDNGFPCEVTPHCVPQGDHNQRVVYLIKFIHEVIERENLRYNNTNNN